MDDDDERWAILDEHLRATCASVRPRHHGLTCVRDGRALVLDRVRVLEQDWLVLRTHVCDEKELDPRAVHERNGQLAIAALVVEAGRYLFRVALPLETTTPDVLDRMIALAFDAARRLRPFHAAANPNARLDVAYFTE